MPRLEALRAMPLKAFLPTDRLQKVNRDKCDSTPIFLEFTVHFWATLQIRWRSLGVYTSCFCGGRGH